MFIIGLLKNIAYDIAVENLFTKNKQFEDNLANAS